MSRSAVRGLWLAQNAEWERIEAMRQVPPAPGASPLVLPERLTVAAGDYTISPEFAAWWNAAEAERTSGAWLKPLTVDLAQRQIDLSMGQNAKTAALTFGAADGVPSVGTQADGVQAQPVGVFGVAPGPLSHQSNPMAYAALPPQAWAGDPVGGGGGGRIEWGDRDPAPSVPPVPVAGEAPGAPGLGLVLIVMGAVVLYVVATS